MDDAELINQVLKGEYESITFLVNRYQKLVVHGLFSPSIGIINE
jgi:hypothetical protein